MYVCLSVRIEQPAPTGRIFMKFDIGLFFENLLRKFKFQQTPKGITGTLVEDLSTFTISR